MKKIIWLLCAITLCATALLFAEKKVATSIKLNQTIDSLVVDKSEQYLYVYTNKKVLKKYACGIGSNAIGQKQKQGDNRTPEGKYYITARNANSAYYKNLHISYPNEADRKRCKKNKVNPGGDIKIHGYVNLFGNFSDRTTHYGTTWGCVGVSNADMDELFRWVKDGAVILLKA
jgi:murein L,D-transpeptidase YafK